METLKFGKFKGQKFIDTPIWYQNWLLKQDWFKAPKQQKPLPLHRQSLSGWDGYSKRGQAIYDAIFEEEKAESDRMYCDCGNMKDPSEKYCGYGCIAEC